MNWSKHGAKYNDEYSKCFSKESEKEGDGRITLDAMRILCQDLGLEEPTSKTHAKKVCPCPCLGHEFAC